MNRQSSYEMVTKAVLAMVACTALTGCGQAADTADEFAPLATVVSETRGAQHENAGGLETNNSTTLRIGDTESTVDTVERLETANAQVGASSVVIVNRADRASRRFSIDEPAAQLSISNGASQVNIRVDNLGRTFVNGVMARDEDEAARMAFDSNPSLQNVPLPILAEADRRLGALPEHRGAVGRALKWVGRRIVRAVWCRLSQGHWVCR